MRKPILFLIVILAGIILSACASSTDAPVQAVQNYLNALVNKEADKLPTLVCGEWEDDALIELDSFQAVTASARKCRLLPDQALTAMPPSSSAPGNIVATYNDEDQKLDLSTRTYQVIEQGGDWLVCGTR
ncbi:MAG: hypothetical protein M0C28_34725 [Candidatus Moduliflexus flocculans]|nr:hypothetical protein [Candidatus Moduliflexus flocculans]